MTKDIEFILFYIDKKRYAVPIQNIERVLRAVAITAVPESPEFLKGVFNLHGTTVPVYDIRKRLGHPQREIVASDFFIVLKHCGQLLAIPVDQIEGIQHTTVPEETNSDISENKSVIDRVIKLGSIVVLLINPVSMFEQLAAHIEI